MRFLCKIGFHDWEYIKAPWRVRICRDCKKAQAESYDMSCGGTIWETSKIICRNEYCKCSRRDDFHNLSFCLNCGGRNSHI